MNPYRAGGLEVVRCGRSTIRKPGVLVEFVLDHVRGQHLDVDLHDTLVGAVGLGVEAVPGVTAPAVEFLVAIHGLPPVFQKNARHCSATARIAARGPGKCAPAGKIVPTQLKPGVGPWPGVGSGDRKRLRSLRGTGVVLQAHVAGQAVAILGVGLARDQRREVVAAASVMPKPSRLMKCAASSSRRWRPPPAAPRRCSSGSACPCRARCRASPRSCPRRPSPRRPCPRRRPARRRSARRCAAPSAAGSRPRPSGTCSRVRP
jgi:hypothetical protein